MKGWVYVITNKAMPGILKVGYTMKDPELRAAELNHTGSPHPYIVDYEVLVEDPREVEQTAHINLKEQREGKEWFRCTTEEAIVAIKSINTIKIYVENFKRADREKTILIQQQREEQARAIKQQREEQARAIQQQREEQAKAIQQQQEAETIAKLAAIEERRKQKSMLINKRDAVISEYENRLESIIKLTDFEAFLVSALYWNGAAIIMIIIIFAFDGGYFFSAFILNSFFIFFLLEYLLCLASHQTEVNLQSIKILFWNEIKILR